MRLGGHLSYMGGWCGSGCASPTQDTRLSTLQAYKVSLTKTMVLVTPPPPMDNIKLAIVASKIEMVVA